MSRFLLGYVRRHHLAAIALLFAMGGTSYAAVSLPKNSVGTAQLRTNAVVSAKVKNGSLLARDFAPGQLPAVRQGPPGPAGRQGPAGPQGPKGDPGQPTLPRIAYATKSATLPAGDTDTLSVSCPSGLYVVGGGGRITGDQANDAGLADAGPSGNTAFTATFWNFTASGDDQTATVYATCIPASSVSS
jgi:hypothetical protein